MSRWFRMYDDVLDDPKVQRLDPVQFKAWVNLLCLASRNDGVLPPLEDIAFALRMSQDVTRDMVVTLSQRGLLDDSDGLSPHNWAGRQFKSDTSENAAERKRKQRAREKEGQKPENVTVTNCDSHNEVTPPETEQNRTEQSRAEQTRARDSEFPHGKEVGDILDKHAGALDGWEHEFLISIRWKSKLSKSQAESLAAIRAKLASKGADPPALLSVKRGTPGYEAWVNVYRVEAARMGKPKCWHETQDSLTVPSEFPPNGAAA